MTKEILKAIRARCDREQRDIYDMEHIVDRVPRLLDALESGIKALEYFRDDTGIPVAEDALAAIDRILSGEK